MGFDHLKKLKVSAAAVRRFPLPEIADDAVLDVKPAGEINVAYFNESMKQSSRSDLKKAGTNKMDAGMMARSRELDRTLYAEHVIVGWSGVIDDQKQVVPFSKETCRELLEALPDDVFDQIRTFCQEPANFRDAPVGERTGNSSTG